MVDRVEHQHNKQLSTFTWIYIISHRYAPPLLLGGRRCLQTQINLLLAAAFPGAPATTDENAGC